MRVSTVLILLIFACCGCGLFLFTGMNHIFEKELQAKESLSQKKLAMRDLSILETSFEQWLVLSDLVLGSDQTYLQQGAIDLATKIHSLKRGLDIQLRMLPDARQHLAVFDAFATRQTKRLSQAMSLGGNNREELLYDLLSEMDEDAAKPIEALSALRNSLDVEHRLAVARIKQVSVKSRWQQVYLLAFFVLAILLIWTQGSRRLGQPIEKLTAESKQALLEGRKFASIGAGPIEVAELRTSFVELVDSLKDKISQINQEQAERELMHQEMVEISRKAGMAEVASEVLHNVGNVLNSLNVSATLTRKQLESSSVKKLMIARDAIKNNKDDLVAFFTESKMGKHFPGALDVVTKQLESENRRLLEESDQLIENISHVKSVINTQQSFARAGGLIQSFCLDDLISAAAKIVSDELSRHGVKVVVECPKTLSMTTDKDKLKQILVNLMGNACDAVVEHVHDRSISISATELDGSVAVSVTDSGVGIREDDMQQLFRHGFTTKEKGHGFGLHSCALAAQVMGGGLEAKSDGEGLGATFILTIPKEQAGLCKV